MAELKKFKIKYYVNWRLTPELIEEKIEETVLTKEELLQHAHVIAVEEIVEPIEKVVVKKPKK